MSEIEESLEDFEEQVGKTLSKEQCELAVERLVRDWGGYVAALHAVIDRLDLDIVTNEQNAEEDPDDRISAQDCRNMKELKKYLMQGKLFAERKII